MAILPHYCMFVHRYIFIYTHIILCMHVYLHPYVHENVTLQLLREMSVIFKSILSFQNKTKI